MSITHMMNTIGAYFSAPKTATTICKKKIPSMFSARKDANAAKKQVESTLSPTEKEAVEADTLNSKLWKECLEIFESKGKKNFVDHVTELFLCIICQEVPVNPVTTPCLHNFCMACLKLAFKSTETQNCPCCRHSLSKYQPEHNEKLKCALHTIMPGYDTGRK